MRHVLAVVAVALAASLVFVPVASAQTKYVRGTVVSAAGDSFVVKVAGKDMTFKVDKTTMLEARGAGKAQREAEKMGAAGVKFADFVKAGVGVEVHYKDVAGTLVATDIQSGLPPSEGSESKEPAGGSARGTVTAVTGSAVTIKGADKDWTFNVDSKTSVVGQGLGTINRQFQDQGKSPTIGDLLKANDVVYVYFKDVAGKMVASEIRVLTKAK